MNRESLRPRLVATLNAYNVTPSFERDERLVSGDLHSSAVGTFKRFVRAAVAKQKRIGSAYFLSSSEERTANGDLPVAWRNQAQRRLDDMS
jgi:hypothetical protein